MAQNSAAVGRCRVAGVWAQDAKRMLVGYEANNILRNSGRLGDYGRTLVSKLASRHIADYRALLFASHIRKAYRTFHTGFANVSTYLPSGMAKLLPEAWLRYQIEPWLSAERVKVFHALNEELPYNIGRNVKTVVTCYDPGNHWCNSLFDRMLWKRRMSYSFAVADAVVVPGEEVRRRLEAEGVMPEKIVVIGTGSPYEVTDQMVEQYFQLYSKLAGPKA